MNLKIFLIIGSLIILGGMIYYLKTTNKLDDFFNNEENSIEDIIKIDEDDKEETEIIIPYYYVDIKGAVINPNVYMLEKDKRVIDAINMAGGFSEQADSSLLNLSKKISDEMVIIVYTKNEVKNFKNKIASNQIDHLIDYLEGNNPCPDPKTNQACLNPNQPNSENPNQPSSKVSINKADLKQLLTLPGIGEVKAQAILSYKEENGPFETIEDLKKVNGIGESTFDKIKDYLTL